MDDIGQCRTGLDGNSPDLIARAAIFTTTSGLASKMTNKTPIGQVTRYKSNPGPSSFAKVTIPVGAGRFATSVIPCNIESYFPGLLRSNRETRTLDSLPSETSFSAA